MCCLHGPPCVSVAVCLSAATSHQLLVSGQYPAHWVVAKACLDPNWEVAADTRRYAVMFLANLSASTDGAGRQPLAFFARIPLIVAWAERNRQRLESIGIRNVCAPLKDEGDEVVKALVFQLERNLGDSSKDPRTM